MGKADISNEKYFWIFGFLTSLFMGWTMADLLIKWLKIVSSDIDTLCRDSFCGEFILFYASLCIFVTLVLSVYRYIFSINEKNPLRNAMWLAYHSVVFSTVFYVFRLELPFTLIVFAGAVKTFIDHIATKGNRGCSYITEESILWSAVFYGLSASLMLITLGSGFISNIGASGLLIFVTVAVLSYLTIFIKAAAEDS